MAAEQEIPWHSEAQRSTRGGGARLLILVYGVMGSPFDAPPFFFSSACFVHPSCVPSCAPHVPFYPFYPLPLLCTMPFPRARVCTVRTWHAQHMQFLGQKLGKPLKISTPPTSFEYRYLTVDKNSGKSRGGGGGGG